MSYKLAIIGFGGMGNYHFDQIKERIPEIEVVGVFDVRQERLDYAKESGLKAYTSVDELIEDKEVQIVLIATPNDFHAPLSIKCMRGGKNVVCEKPVTMNAPELEEVLKVSKETGKVFVVHQNRRWDKDYVIIKNILDNKLLGRAFYVENRVQGSKRSLEGWRGFKLNGGGMVYDWGIHLIDQTMWLIKSPVVDVQGHLARMFSTEVDDNFKAFLKFEDGTSALIEVSTNCFIPQARWHMMCEDGTAIVEDWECNGKMVRLSDDRDLGWEDQIVYTVAGPTRTMAPRPRETTEELSLPEVKSDWADYYKNVIAAIEGREELIVKPAESLRVMKVVDAIFESDKTGHSVACHI